MKNISAKELKVAMGDGAAFTLVDIREEDAYHEKHIPNALNLPPVEQTPENAGQVIADKNTWIIVYGGDGDGEAGATCGKLEGLGYTNVSCLSGGIMGWMEAGYPVEFGEVS